MADAKNLFVLVHFFEESKFSVLRLKECTNKQDISYQEIKNWMPTKVIEVPWLGTTYPAHFLQFGENRKEMEKTIDALVGKVKALTDIPLIQEPSRSRGAIEKKNVNRKKNTIINKEEKLDMIRNVKRKVMAEEEETTCIECSNLKLKNNALTDECTKLKVQLSNKERELSKMSEKLLKYKLKYKSLKGRFNPVDDASTKEKLVKIGSGVLVSEGKLTKCRTSNFSKYTGDLLLVVFGREVLGRSVLKGIKGGKKENVLDKDMIADIESHVSSKFNVDCSRVRAAIRQKLNVCDKEVKRENVI